MLNSILNKSEKVFSYHNITIIGTIGTRFP